MNPDCTKWKDQLLEAALAGSPANPLAQHLQQCADCSREFAALRLRQQQIDALLPRIARDAQPSSQFRARVLTAAAAEASAENKHARPWRVLTLAAAATAVFAAFLTGVISQRRSAALLAPADLVVAQKLADWQAPSDVLLQTPGSEILRATPKLGESYLKVPAKKVQED